MDDKAISRHTSLGSASAVLERKKTPEQTRREGRRAERAGEGDSPGSLQILRLYQAQHLVIFSISSLQDHLEKKSA